MNVLPSCFFCVGHDHCCFESEHLEEKEGEAFGHHEDQEPSWGPAAFMRYDYMAEKQLIGLFSLVV